MGFSLQATPTNFETDFDDSDSSGYERKTLSGYRQQGPRIEQAPWVKNQRDADSTKPKRQQGPVDLRRMATPKLRCHKDLERAINKMRAAGMSKEEIKEFFMARKRRYQQQQAAQRGDPRRQQDPRRPDPRRPVVPVPSGAVGYGHK